MIMILLVKVSTSVQTLAFPRLDAAPAPRFSLFLPPPPTLLDTTYAMVLSLPPKQGTFLPPLCYLSYLHHTFFLWYLNLSFSLCYFPFPGFTIPILSHLIKVLLCLDPLHPSTCPHKDNSKSISFKTFVSSGEDNF